ncbi:hypothetical protein [Flaviflexus equikiangi]|uniref:Uncharacterized protein n=1 Tax=Flaviflexus equikiangi TaxID=2758573 RepID=A0ABS2TCF6_9ACTO|nr:hypothetical protein [Flaviflexus equikiangi]MBM9432324.1 hypothetical protein [Flaviflexus equikiangi]
MDALAKLDTVSAEILSAGGRVTGVEPLAHPETPHVIVAHRVTVSSPTPDVDTVVRQILADHHVSTRGLVPWLDPDIVEGAEDESNID